MERLEGDDFIDYSAIKGTDDWLGPDPNDAGRVTQPGLASSMVLKPGMR